ncbi:hypothetical protein [Modestobacter sp. VKM Ac-2978]|uniref:hypothetical protein n=1 Tax=Modestobacter sp. VKM Ac-2978 TaxID=3004132 RepID=UPI0022AB0846|nr:hypothetical protein [Modestobacter sp. VKM Ac-2978]MCZ2846984.1 hypothetical protein [Modestobacter sp. VKM Ac-2978]
MTSFAGLPLISLLGSVALIPVITSVSGAQGWAAVALGQALGGGASTVLQYGWGFVGPSRLVPLSAHERGRLLWTSVLSRLVIAVVLVPLVAVAAVFLAPDEHRLLAALTAVAMSTFGMSSLWFFVGTGRPGHAARYETVPRLAILLLAALVVLLTWDPLWYPIIFLVGQVIAISWLVHRMGVVSLDRRARSDVRAVLSQQRAAAATDVVFALTLALPTSIVAAVAPAALPVFAGGDRVQRLAQSGIQPLFNAFQGWVSEGPRADLAARMRTAVAVTGGCGALVGLAFAVGLPMVDGVLFAGEISIGFGVSSCFGLALALYALTSSINFTVLAPVGLTRLILRGTAVGGVVVIVGVSVLPHALGALGGALAVASAQLSTLLVQLPVVRRVLRGEVTPAVVAPDGVTPGGVTPGGVTPGGVTPGGVTPAGVASAGITPAVGTLPVDPQVDGARKGAPR